MAKPSEQAELSSQPDDPKPTSTDRKAEKVLFGQKLCYLLGLIPITPTRFATDFRTKDPRQPIKWTKGLTLPQETGKTSLLEFLSGRLKIDLDDRLYAPGCSFDEFKSCVDDARKACQTRITIDLPSPLRVMSKSMLRDLCGSYYVIRYSFHGDMKRPRLVRDVLLITAPGEDTPVVDLQLHVFPTDGRGLPRDGYEEATRVETFNGHLYWYGKCFYGIVTYSDGKQDNRMRTLSFPLVGQRSFTYWGIISGFSQRLSEPVSAKAVVDKFNHEAPPWTQADLKKVRRYDSKSYSDIVEYVSLVDNHIHDNSTLLAVNKEWPQYKSLQGETMALLALPEEADQPSEDDT